MKYKLCYDFIIREDYENIFITYNPHNGEILKLNLMAKQIIDALQKSEMSLEELVDKISLMYMNVNKTKISEDISNFLDKAKELELIDTCLQ